MGSGNEEIDWTKFEGKEGGDYLKFTDGEEHVVGINGLAPSTRMFKRKNAQGIEVDTPVYSIDVQIGYLDGKTLPAPKIFSTSAAYLAKQLKELKQSGALTGWLFKLKRQGMGIHTRYNLTPMQPKPNTTPAKSDQISAFV